MYRERRRNPLDSDETFEEALKELVDSFSEAWINSDSGHPLQKLWHRKDILASIELTTLGLSIQKIKTISPDQVKQNIKIIKDNDRGNMMNAAWEIILAAAFHTPPKQYSRLLGPRRPTYDIEVEFSDGSKDHISVRTFGQSKKDIEFSNQFESIEKIIKNNINISLQIVIFRDNAYPSPYQWDILKRKLPDIIKKSRNSINSIEDWTIMIGPITDESVRVLAKSDQAKLYTKNVSYTLLMTLPFYKNEDRNIESELAKKCSDLISKGFDETNKSINSMIIHLPEYVSIDNYTNWCKKFFEDMPNASISYISLIQPAYITDLDKDESYLSILYRIIPRPNKPGFANKLHGAFPTGKPNTDSAKFILNTGFEISKYHYIRQSGHVFADYGDITNGGKMNMRFNYGIIIHAIGKFKDDELIVSANFPPTTKLVML